MMLIRPVSRSRIFFFLLLAVATLGHRALSVQARSVDIQPTAGSRIETTPGKLLTVSFKVTNTGSSKKRFESSVVPPTGWRRLAREFPFEIEAGASDIRLVSVSIPAETPAGDYVLRYGVRDPANPSDAAEISLTVAITAVSDQGLKLVDSPRLVVAGEAYQLLFLLTNKGNVTSRVRLTARSSNNFIAAPDSSIIHLKAGESRSIHVDVRTDLALSSKVQDIVELMAEPDIGNPAKANSYVEVVPRVTGVEERYVRFPVTARMRLAGEGKRMGAQVELFGSGSLSENEDDRLDLLIRTPDIQERSILGRRDEYQVNYRTMEYELFLGDKNYTLSPLTEFNRYAFGASGTTTVRGVSVGGFYNVTRFLSPTQQEWAGFVNVPVHDAVQVGLNVLRKHERDRSNVVTARSIIRPLINSELDVEYGFGGNGSEGDAAFAGRWTNRSSWYSVDARYVRAGTHYPGYYKDVDLKNLSFNLAPWSDLKLEGYYRIEQRNLDRDTTLLLAPRDRYYQVGIGFANFFAVYYKSNDQDDLLPAPQYKRRDKTWQLRAGFSLTDFMLIGNADLGTLDDLLAGSENPYKRYSLYASVQPFSGHTYGFTVEYSDEREPTTATTQHRLAGSFSANIFLAEATQFSLSLFGNRTRGEFEQTYSLVDLSFDHTFESGHTMALKGRQSIFTPSFEGKEIAYSAEYSIPIGVPVARSRVSGQLFGRVIDAEKGEPIRNVLVYAGGSTAVTDVRGEYSFPALKPERYVLQLDMVSVGMNRVAQQRLPQEITVVGGEEGRFDISVTRAVTVSGTVLMFGAKEQPAGDSAQPELIELGGHSNVVVELSNGEEIHRRLTDSRGRYAFSGIRPGRWTLSIVDGNLPQNYQFDRPSHDMTLTPGQSAEMNFKAIPRKRRVQIIQQGQTILVAPQQGKVGVAQKPEQKPPAPVAQKPPEKLVQKPVESPAQKPLVTIPAEAKRIDTLAQKESKVTEVRPAELKKPARGIPIARSQPAKISGEVVFLPAKLLFAIEYSSWPTREMADSAAARASKVPRLKVSVREYTLANGQNACKVIIGYFSSRTRAEAANAAVREILILR